MEDFIADLVIASCFDCFERCMAKPIEELTPEEAAVECAAFVVVSEKMRLAKEPSVIHPGLILDPYDLFPRRKL